MAADVQTLQYIISFKTIGQVQALQHLKAIQTAVGAQEVSFKKTSSAASGLNMDIGKLAARAAITIPVWLAMRSAFMSVLQTIGDGASYIVNFNKELAEMATISKGELSNLPMFMRQLATEIRSLSNSTGKSVSEIADVYKAFAETGMKAADAQAGMNVALKLSVATFADHKQTARMMVDVYKLFGDTMDAALTPQQKMESIAGSFVMLWRENAGTLGEYINALKMFAPIARNYNLSIDQTLTTTIVLHNYMQRSTMAGTQLARAFSEMTKNADKFDAIGIKIAGRTDWMNIFMETLTKLSKIEPGKRGTLMSQLFGERSVKGTAALASYEAIEKISKTLYDLSNMDAATRLKVLDEAFNMQNETLKVQIDRFQLLKAQMGEAFITGITGTTDFKDGMKKMNDFIQSTLIPTINKLAGAIRAVGIALAVVSAVKTLGFLMGAGKGGVPILTAGIDATNSSTMTATGTAYLGRSGQTGKLLSGLAGVGRSRTSGAITGAVATAALAASSMAMGSPAIATTEGIVATTFTKFFGPGSKIYMLFMGLNKLLGPIGWTITALLVGFDLIKKGQEKEIDDALQAAKKGKSYSQFYAESQKNPSLTDWMTNPQRALGRLGVKQLNPMAQGETPGWYTKASQMPVIGGLVRRAFGQQFAVRDAMTAFDTMKGKGPLSPEDQAKADQAQDEWIKIRLANVQKLKAYGYDTLTIEHEKLRILKDEWKTEEDNLKIKEQELKILETEIALVNEYAGIMQGKLQSAFTDIMSGAGGWGGIGQALNDSMIEGYRKSMSEGLTNVVMSTGIGELFGVSMANIKSSFGGLSGKIEGAFDTGGKTVYDWIVKAFYQVTGSKTGISSGGAYSAGAPGSTTARMSGALGGTLGAVFGGSTGWFAQPAFNNQMSYNGQNGGFSGVIGTGSGYGYNSGGTKGVGNISRGQLAGAGLQGVMTGYSAYQSAKQSGSGGFGAVASGALGAGGAVAGAISGVLAASALTASVAAGGGAAGAAAAAGVTLLGMGPVGWAVLAGALAITAIFASSMGKKKTTQTQVQTQTTVNELASKIDVSNKKLELINRNLVALRNTMETYIMPTSTYFSTARNLEDEFAISARRG